MRRICSVVVMVVAAVLVVGGLDAPTAEAASVSLSAPYSVTAGKRAVIRARVFDYRLGRVPRRTCRLTASGRPKLKGLGRRTGRTTFRWRVRVPSKAWPETAYKLQVVCRGAGRDRDSFEVEAATMRAAVREAAVYPGGYWTVVVENPNRYFEIRGGSFRLNFVDQYGRIVRTDEETPAILAPGERVRISGEVSGSAEPPVAVRVTPLAGSRWPGASSPLIVSDVRIVADVTDYGFGFVDTDYSVRATILNPNRLAASGLTKAWISVYDAAGNLTWATYTYPIDSSLDSGEAVGLNYPILSVEVGQKAARAEVSVETDLEH